MAKSKSINLCPAHDGRAIFVNDEGQLKHGANAKYAHPHMVTSKLPKSVRRRVRKALVSKGFTESMISTLGDCARKYYAYN